VRLLKAQNRDPQELLDVHCQVYERSYLCPVDKLKDRIYNVCGGRVKAKGEAPRQDN
jgi:hypothetical protein